jgi:hypothetical protein
MGQKPRHAYTVRRVWVLDLRRRCLVVHRQPEGTEYATILTVPESEAVAIEVTNGTISVAAMLPDRIKQ